MSTPVHAGAEEQRIAIEYQPFVQAIARKVKNSLQLSCDLDDLVACGLQGLLEAHRRYDATRGVQFRTFAYYRIRGAIIDGIRKMSYLSRRTHARLRAAEAADQLLEPLGEERAANPAERLAVVATTVSLANALERISSAYVLSALGQGSEEDTATPEEKLAGEQRKQRLRRALSSLDERERKLVQGFYFDDRRFDEVAAEMGISKSWASRLHAKALDRLRLALHDADDDQDADGGDDGNNGDDGEEG